MANENKIPEIIRSSMESIRTMVDANTVIGDPISTEAGTTIIPISKISIGIASGGVDYNPKKDAQPRPRTSVAAAVRVCRSLPQASSSSTVTATSSISTVIRRASPIPLIRLPISSSVRPTSSPRSRISLPRTSPRTTRIFKKRYKDARGCVLLFF